MNPHLSKNKKFSRFTSLLLCTLAYTLAIFIGMLTQQFFFSFGDLWSVFIADIVATIIIFLLGLFVSNASLYDPYWSVAPVPIALYWWSLSGFDTAINKLLLLMILFYWAIRLTLNWARGWTGFEHEDWRYQMLRKKNGKFYQFVNLSGIHLFPTILVFLGMIPCYYVLSSITYSYNILITIFASILGILAVTIALIADENLKKFVQKNKIKGAFLQKGFWKYSRHPNYFGEVSFWGSMWFFALAIDTNYWFTGIGVLAMFLLFWFISIPMMDKRMLERRNNYKAYMDKTSRFFLLPPKK